MSGGSSSTRVEVRFNSPFWYDLPGSGIIENLTLWGAVGTNSGSNFKRINAFAPGVFVIDEWNGNSYAKISISDHILQPRYSLSRSGWTDYVGWVQYQ